jgi:hypothetical protein
VRNGKDSQGAGRGGSLFPTSPTSTLREDTTLIRIRLNMNNTTVDINPKHMYLITLFGSLYADGSGLCDPAEDFLHSIGRCEEYDPDVSRDEGVEESSEVYSESSSESVSYLCFSIS